LEVWKGWWTTASTKPQPKLLNQKQEPLLGLLISLTGIIYSVTLLTVIYQIPSHFLLWFEIPHT
jgi:hypothetical protein